MRPTVWSRLDKLVPQSLAACYWGMHTKRAGVASPTDRTGNAAFGTGNLGGPRPMDIAELVFLAVIGVVALVLIATA
jgi:hypothetical protein